MKLRINQVYVTRTGKLVRITTHHKDMPTYTYRGYMLRPNGSKVLFSMFRYTSDGRYDKYVEHDLDIIAEHSL